MQPIAQIEKCNMNMALFISSFHRLPVALGRATKPDWLRHGGVRNRCPGTSCVLGEESVTEVGALRVSHQHSCCCVFPMICGSGGSKSRLAKAAGAEPAGQRRDEKLHAVVARSTFPSEKVQNTPFSDQCWKLRCQKSARRCGAKHISKSKCTKHLRSGPLLEVAMSKKCTPLWREAHFQVKMHKAHQVRTTFGSCDVEKVHAVVARSTFPSQNVQNTSAPDHFWKLRCRKSARRCGAKHISKSKCTKHTRFGPLLEVEMSKKCTPLWREAHFQVKSVKN